MHVVKTLCQFDAQSVIRAANETGSVTTDAYYLVLQAADKPKGFGTAADGVSGTSLPSAAATTGAYWTDVKCTLAEMQARPCTPAQPRKQLSERVAK